MTSWLERRAADFEPRFAELLAAKREVSRDVNDAVAAILAKVRADKDAALIELTARYDRVDLRKVGIRVTPEEIAHARAAVDAKTLAALELARDRILAHHRRQVPADDSHIDDMGVELGTRWTPLQSVGLYVPGGTASYPSSVLMNALPAKVAGVRRIVMVVPAPDGKLNPLVPVAAELAGVDEIYRVGGAQAVAALAYGTETIAPVAKIVGPGNAYVAAAKRQVFGEVGIDMIAGPSEVVVIADRDNDPDWIASDLLAQAEHDEAAQSILIGHDAFNADLRDSALFLSHDMNAAAVSELADDVRVLVVVCKQPCPVRKRRSAIHDLLRGAAMGHVAVGRTVPCGLPASRSYPGSAARGCAASAAMRWDKGSTET